MIDVEKVSIRRMTEAEVALAVDWAAREGWNPGLYDAACFYAADPRGFFLAECDGRPVGCLSAAAYDDAFAFVGFYIVDPGHRGLGIGHHLVRAATAYLGNRTVGNDAVVAQQGTYQRYGFRFAYRNIRYRGVAKPAGSDAAGIVDARTIPFETLAAYDRELFPAPRPSFLARWIDQPRGAALGFQKEGKLSGYGVIRPCRQGWKIGPLFADDAATAEALFAALAARAAGEEVFLDIPEPNVEARALTARHRMETVFETARMYIGQPPSLPLGRIFGVTSFELG